MMQRVARVCQRQLSYLSFLERGQTDATEFRFRFIIVIVAQRLKITKFEISNTINSKVQIYYNVIQWREVF